MTLFCQYKNLLGKPGKGTHAARIAGFALNDLLATVALAWVVSKYMKWGLVKAFIVSFGVATLLHWLFCVDTAFMKLLF